MTRIYLLILIVFLILFSALIAVNLDTAASVIPGWHTTIVDISWIFYTWIFITFAVYYGIYKAKVSFSKTLVLIHIILTTPLLIISLVSANLIINQSNISVLEVLVNLHFIFAFLFLIGQLLFICQLINIYIKLKAQSK